jgi:hypothetical protein
VEAGQVPQEESVRESFGEADVMLSKLKLEPDIDREEKEKKWQRAKPSPHIEDRNVGSVAEVRALPNQDLPDKKAAQDKKQLDTIKTAVAEDSKDTDQMRIKHDQPMRADDGRDCRGSEEIEAEDAIGRTRHA